MCRTGNKVNLNLFASYKYKGRPVRLLAQPILDVVLECFSHRRKGQYGLEFQGIHVFVLLQLTLVYDVLWGHQRKWSSSTPILASLQRCRGFQTASRASPKQQDSNGLRTDRDLPLLQEC